MNWTDPQWELFAKGLNDLYHASVDSKIVPAVISDYTWAEKASRHELTVDEVSWLIGIMFMKSQGMDMG